MFANILPCCVMLRTAYPSASPTPTTSSAGEETMHLMAEVATPGNSCSSRLVMKLYSSMRPAAPPITTCMHEQQPVGVPSDMTVKR